MEGSRLRARLQVLGKNWMHWCFFTAAKLKPASKSRLASSMVPAGARSTKLMPRPVTVRTAIRKWVAVESSFGNLAILQPDRLWQQLRVFLRDVDVLARGKRRPRFS